MELPGESNLSHRQSSGFGDRLDSDIDSLQRLLLDRITESNEESVISASRRELSRSFQLKFQLRTYRTKLGSWIDPRMDE